jgi:hypothetical protein
MNFLSLRRDDAISTSTIESTRLEHSKGKVVSSRDLAIDFAKKIKKPKHKKKDFRIDPYSPKAQEEDGILDGLDSYFSKDGGNEF